MLKKSEARRQQKRADTEEQIIRAALPLIREHTFMQLSIRDFCEQAGISTGMFYRHFKAKNDVVVRVYASEIERVLQTIDERIEGLPLAEQLTILEVELCRCNLLLGREGIFIFTNQENGGADCEDTRSSVVGKMASLIRSSGEWQSSGDRTPEDISNDIIMIGKGVIFEWYARGEDYDFIGNVEKLVRRTVPALLKN